MIELYLWDEQGLYAGVQEVDEAGALPVRSTPTKPMKLTGKQVARWTGEGWEKLASAPVVEVLTLPVDEVSRLYERAVQATLDAAAVAARYDSIATAVSYAEEPAVPKFQNDGKAFRAWRSKVWAYAYQQLALVLAGEREQPTVEAFLLELPVLELPA
jgi:hypothetical protein